MAKFDWSNTTPEELKKMAAHKMAPHDFNRYWNGNFECEPLTEKEKQAIAEFKEDAKDYELRRNKGLVNIEYSGA